MRKAKSLDEFFSACEVSPCTIFGAAKLGEKLNVILKKKDVTIDCFIDNYKTGQTKATGTKIISATQMAEYYQCKNIVIIAVVDSQKAQAVLFQLLEMGYKKEQIYSVSEVNDIMAGMNFSFRDWGDAYDWEYGRERVRKIAEWIDEQDLSVVDYGAGDMFLRTLLSDEVHYTPIDLIKRAPEIIVCDFNTDPFPGVNGDVGVVIGVLSYISNPDVFISNVCKATKEKVLINYNFDTVRYSVNEVMLGHVNNLSKTELVDMFNISGFDLRDEKVSLDGGGTLLCFGRR